jgi:hypothetical protein
MFKEDRALNFLDSHPRVGSCKPLGNSLSFLPKNPFIAVGAVELWVTRSVIQAPCGQREVLSIRHGKSISPNDFLL